MGKIERGFHSLGDHFMHEVLSVAYKTTTRYKERIAGFISRGRGWLNTDWAVCLAVVQVGQEWDTENLSR